MLAVEIQDDLAILQRSLEEYAQLSGKTSEEVLEKKGRDISMRLSAVFRGRQWGGPTRRSGLALAEFEARVKAHSGTKVREALVKEFEMRKGQVSRLAKSAGKFVKLDKAQRKALAAIRRAAALSVSELWRTYMAKEISIRQHGIGVLAAGWFRYRKRQLSGGTQFARNKRGRSLGLVEEGKGSLRFGNLVPGADVIAGRYDLLSGVIREVVADIADYTHRKHTEKFQQAFRRLSATV